jgi:hypothetical protein
MSERKDIAEPSGPAPVNEGNSSDYDVGYGKPPKTSRFPKGKSGNPGGRKKTKRIDNVRTLVDDVLDEQVQVRDGAKIRTVSGLEGILQTHRIEALKGNSKSARDFFKLARKAGMLSKVMPESFVKLMEPGGDDGKVIRMYRAEQEALARKALADTSPEPPNESPKKER